MLVHLNFYDLNGSRINLWWVLCCCWRGRSRRRVVGGDQGGVAECFRLSNSGIQSFHSPISPSTVVVRIDRIFRSTLILYNSVVLVLVIGFQNADTVATPTFAATFRVQCSEEAAFHLNSVCLVLVTFSMTWLFLMTQDLQWMNCLHFYKLKSIKILMDKKWIKFVNIFNLKC